MIQKQKLSTVGHFRTAANQEKSSSNAREPLGAISGTSGSQVQQLSTPRSQPESTVVDKAPARVASAQSTVSVTPSAIADPLLVFFAVKIGEDHRLAQIHVHGIHDDEFFDELRHQYKKLRGVVRHIFSIWGYAGSDFFKVGNPGSIIPNIVLKLKTYF